jgi:hypothetical protein
MNMGKEKKKKQDDKVLLCPVGKFFWNMEKRAGEKSKFYDHLSRSRIEFLKALRCLVDESIENLEKHGKRDSGKRLSKIEIE